MKISLIVIGKTNKGFVLDGLQEYLKRLKRYIRFELVVIPDVKQSKNLTPEQLIAKEEEVLLPHIADGANTYLLDETGKQFSSMELAQFIEVKMVHGAKELKLIVGGAYGVSNKVKSTVQGKISLSQLTFSHQMVRLILVEQIYRAMTILRGEPYHHQ